MKRHLISLLSVCLIISLVFSCFSYYKFLDYKSKNNEMYSNLIDNFYSYGLEIPQHKIEEVTELLNNNSEEAKTGVETWLLEIASDYGVAENSAALSQVYFRHFFGSLHTLLLDMIRTEKDYSKWKQICFELKDITTYLKTNLNKDDLNDKSKAEDNWNKLMKEIREKYSHTYLISNMNL